MEDHGAAGGARDLEGGGGATRKPGTHGDGVNCDGTDAADRIRSHSGTHWDGASLDGELEEKVIAAVEGTAGTPAPPAAAASGTARSLPAPPPSSSVAVIGVSLEFLQGQLEKINHDDTLTTADMVYQVIIPLLKTIPNRRCTFVEGCHPRPYPDNPESFGRATAFVSHAWRCSFAKLVSALARREQGRCRSAGIEYYWLDIYSKDKFIINAAHTADELTNVVRATGRLLLIMDPWHGPLCVTRVWCLFEIMWALRYDAEVEIALPGDQIDDFLNDLSVNGYDRVNSLLATIDAKKGEASFPDDVPLILGMIETSVGFDALNRTVVEELRRNFSSIVLSYSRSWARSTVEAAIVKVRVSELMLQLGNCVSARDVAAEALADLGTSAEGSGNRGKSDGGSDSGHQLAAFSVLARVNENEKFTMTPFVSSADAMSAILRILSLRSCRWKRRAGSGTRSPRQGGLAKAPSSYRPQWTVGAPSLRQMMVCPETKIFCPFSPCAACLKRTEKVVISKRLEQAMSMWFNVSLTRLATALSIEGRSRRRTVLGKRS